MDKKFLDLAFYYAQIAFDNNEVPIGAVIVKDGVVISVGYNLKNKNNSIFEHAELIAIREASNKLKNWRLDGCDIYITLDPCPMCASAIKQSRICNVYSALNNSDLSTNNIIKAIFEVDNTNPSVSFLSNLDINKSKKLLNDFFKIQRNK